MTTDTTVIQPGAGQSILTTDHNDHDRRRGYDDHCHRELRTDADYRSLIAQGSVNGDRINSGVQVTGDRITAVGRDAAVAACRTNELVQTTSCATDRLVQSGFGGVHDRLCDSSKDAALAACKTNDAIGAAFASTQKQVSDAATATVVGFKESQGLAFQVEGRALLEAAKNANAASVQATANANAATVQVERVRAELALAQQTGFAAAALLATQLDANARREADKCCCEIKELIRAEHAATRQQAADFRMRDLEGRLNRIPTGVAITIPPGL